MSDNPILSIRDLKKHFPIKGGILNRTQGHVRAVDRLSFEVHDGETLGIVGESGCGKSTLARLLMHLLPADGGEILFDGASVGKPSGATSMKQFRRAVQMVFQDSSSSLNPRLPIERSVAYGPQVHGMESVEAKALARRLLAEVGLDPALFAQRYPHELSGGQKQRVNIARALAMKPRLLILDEAVSALDKSVEAQVLNLLRRLKRDFKLTYVFISHDLDVVRYISDRVLVMYLGEIVEIGPVDQIYAEPKHPYTRALLASRLSFDPAERVVEAPLTGDPPNPINPPSGCRFRTRCPLADAICTELPPNMPAAGPRTHRAACHVQVPGSGHNLAGAAPALAA